ncbi:hypothetical protein ABI59_16305 [Acidobacteria bacterium Mor1]|nr:hypothetical protein ABI59_16305 [Acidobacteria bacterium Mor1]
MMLETPFSEISKTAERIQHHITELRERYVGPSTIPWLSTMQPGGDWSRIGEFYNPRTYVCLGIFDLVTIYLSPEIHPFPPADKFPQAGHEVNMCILPVRESGGVDHNEAFIKQYSQEPAPGRLPIQERFTVFVKLKLNPARSWPGDAEGFEQVLSKVWETFDEWHKQYQAPNACHSAVGVSLGWSELIVTAHADSIRKLIELVWRLRCQSGRTFWSRCPDDVTVAHDFVTSVSHVGYDYHVDCDVRALFRPDMKPRELVEAIDEVAKEYDAYPEEGDYPSIHISPTFSCYPGHEARLVDLMEDAFAEEAWSGVHTRPVARADYPGQMGRYDLSGPTLLTSRKFDDTQALIYLSLLQNWLVRDKKDPFGEKSDGVMNFFSVYTQVGLPGFELSDWAGIPEKHTMERAADYPGFKNNLNKRLEEVLTRTLKPMRHLQLPYAWTEQVVNLLSKFQWSIRHDVLWEDSLSFAPLVLCLAGHLETLKSWWETWSLQSWNGPPRPGLPVDGYRRTVAEIKNRLTTFHKEELPTLMSAFRANFHHRQLGGYLTDQAPDFNLRYRGSVQQLLNITGMVLDSLADVVLGPRACTASVGDSVTPKVSMSCDAVVASLHVDTITMPILLESLAHEVGNVMMLELLEACDVQENPPPGEVVPNPWATDYFTEGTFQEMRETLFELRREVFLGEIDLGGYFVESASDYIELLVLGYPAVEKWAPSFLLRCLMASTPVHQDLPSGDDLRGPFVPSMVPHQMLASLIRVIHVTFASRLADSEALDPEDEAAWEELWERMVDEAVALRESLATQCVVGDSRAIIEQVGDEKEWRRLIGIAQRYAPWLYDARAAAASQAFYRAVRKHTLERSGKDAQWTAIRKEIGELRQVVLPLLSPSLYATHWLTEQQSAGEDRDFPEVGDRPWRVTPQPPSHYLDYRDPSTPAQPEPYKVVVFQRGRIAPMNEEVALGLAEANRRFVANLVARLPAWRRSLLDKIGEREGPL